MKRIVLILCILLFHAGIYSNNDFTDEMALLFSGNANRTLSEEVAKYLNASLGSAVVERFKDGEIKIHINNNVRNKDIFLIQSTCNNSSQSVNDSVMELYLLVRTMKRASAKSITAVIPYYGYARQDRKVSGRVPISAADIASMLESAGVDRVITIDLHCGQIQGFFRDIPVDNLYPSNIFISHFSKKNLENIVVVSPDAGGVGRAKKFQEQLKKQNIQSDLAMISKQRAQAGVVSSMNLIGDVEDADAILIDDICDSGGTLVKAAQVLKENGARRVFAVITHPVFSANALDLIENSVLEEIVITDTIPLRGKAPLNLSCISVGELLGEAISRVQNGESVSELFQ